MGNARPVSGSARILPESASRPRTSATETNRLVTPTGVTIAQTVPMRESRNAANWASMTLNTVLMLVKQTSGNVRTTSASRRVTIAMEVKLMGMQNGALTVPMDQMRMKPNAVQIKVIQNTVIGIAVTTENDELFS